MSRPFFAPHSLASSLSLAHSPSRMSGAMSQVSEAISQVSGVTAHSFVASSPFNQSVASGLGGNKNFDPNSGK